MLFNKTWFSFLVQSQQPSFWENVGGAIRAVWQAMPLVGTVLIIAFLIWMMRTWVESDPDPFFLNLTFFAFAGQCIRTSEFIREGRSSAQLLFLLLCGSVMLVVQVLVMRAHMKTTLKYYKTVLTQNKADGCSEQVIEYWANMLLQITGVDFAPGHYNWLIVFNTEPREKRRMDAFAILPEGYFQRTRFTPQSLIIPTDERKLLWNVYMGICLISWVVFVLAIISSAKA